MGMGEGCATVGCVKLGGHPGPCGPIEMTNGLTLWPALLPPWAESDAVTQTVDQNYGGGMVAVMPDGTAMAPLAPATFDNVVCPCNSWSDLPQPCGIHGTRYFTPPIVSHFCRFRDCTTCNPPPEPLSDADVDRIARRVVAMLKEHG